MVQIDGYQNCDGNCAGSKQHESYLNNTYDVPWTILVHDDQVCIFLKNDTSTNMSVNIWAEDSENNGPLTDTNYWVSVLPNTSTCVYIWELGYRADGVSPREEFILHTVLHNDDNESEGVNIWHDVYTGT